MPGSLTRLGARLLRATVLIDRAYQRFDRARSLTVLAGASDGLLEAYGRRVFDQSPTFRAGSGSFRQGLFAWEERAIGECFPPPPARLLVGGAGGGRESLALVARGYRVVAFDPAGVLVRSHCEAARALPDGALRAHCASYADLPGLPATAQFPACDLASEPPFDAAILGWTSLSHILTDDGRVEALVRMARVTRGPLLVSYFGRPDAPAPAAGRLCAIKARALRRGPAMFTVALGFARLISDEDLCDFAARAGLRIARLDHASEWPHAILVAA